MHPTLKLYLVFAAALASAIAAPSAFAEGRDAGLVKRGGFLVGIGGCMDCHMPFKMGANGPEKDLARGLSGHPEALELPPPPKLEGAWNWAGAATMTAFAGPWGVTYAANLTPDRETGIGNWQEKDFMLAMRSGRHVGVARPILPPMPWQAIGALPDRDLRAVFAYLMAQPAIKNKVPDYVPPVSLATRSGG